MSATVGGRSVGSPNTVEGGAFAAGAFGAGARAAGVLAAGAFAAGFFSRTAGLGFAGLIALGGIIWTGGPIEVGAWAMADRPMPTSAAAAAAIRRAPFMEPAQRSSAGSPQP